MIKKHKKIEKKIKKKKILKAEKKILGSSFV